MAGDDVVLTEHIEIWDWPTGETMALPVASVHEIGDGTITRWTDYWDMAALSRGGAPVVVRTCPAGLEVVPSVRPSSEVGLLAVFLRRLRTPCSYAVSWVGMDWCTGTG